MGNLGDIHPMTRIEAHLEFLYGNDKSHSVCLQVEDLMRQQVGTEKSLRAHARAFL